MERQTGHQVINNAFYDDLGSQWYEREDHPIALLRAENRVRNPWIAEEIEKHFPQKAHVLDVGCGAGLLTNDLSERGHHVTGVDLSESSLDEAKRRDPTERVRYIQADACDLPFDRGEFDVVCAMDLLEHVDQPQKLIREASRVLKKGGLFFFHTFNRNWLSYFVIIKGVEWFVKNTPRNMHVYPLFIKPKELKKFCYESHLKVEELKGFHPRINSALLHLIRKREVRKDLCFCFSKTLLTGYCGFARMESTHDTDHFQIKTS